MIGREIRDSRAKLYVHKDRGEKKSSNGDKKPEKKPEKKAGDDKEKKDGPPRKKKKEGKGVDGEEGKKRRT